MDVEIREKERDQGSQLSIRNLDWEYALDQSTRFIKETFPEFDTFYDSLDGQMDVGYTFDLKLGPRGEIAVMSKMHPGGHQPLRHRPHRRRGHGGSLPGPQIQGPKDPGSRAGVPPEKRAGVPR